jgi:hypothetical protein
MRKHHGYFYDNIKENEMAADFDVEVYGTTVVKVFPNHIRITKTDWDNIKQRLIPVLKQGDMKHATGNTEATI